MAAVLGSGPAAPAPADDVLAPPKRPPAAARGVSDLYVLTLLSAVDGSLVALSAAGKLRSFGGAVTVGLLVVAGAGAWLAARQAFAGRHREPRTWRLLGLLGILSVVATAASAWLGASLGQALTLHVLPKATGIVLLLVAAELAGLRVPRLGPVPLAVGVLALGLAVEAVWAWTA